MDFLDKMNVNSGLMNYEQLLKASEVTEEKPKDEKETPDAETEASKQTKQKSIVPYVGNESTNEVEDSEEEETDNKEDKTENKPNENKPNENTELYKTVLKAFIDNVGVELDLDNFTGGPKEMVQAVHDMYSNMVDEEIEEVKSTFFTPLQKRFVDMVEIGVNQQEAIDFFKDYKKIETIDPEEMDEKVAKEVYKVYLKKTTKFSDTKISDEIEELVELGSLTDKAKKIIPDLKDTFKAEEKEKVRLAKEIEENKQKQALQNQEMLKQYIDDTEEIAGIKLTKKMKDDWKKQYQYIQNEKGQLITPVQKIQSEDPAGFEALLKLYVAMGLFNRDGRKKQFSPDFKYVKTLSKNDVFDEVEKAINKQKSKDAAESGRGIEDMDFSPDKKSEIERLIKLGEKYNDF